MQRKSTLVTLASYKAAQGLETLAADRRGTAVTESQE